MNCRSLPILSSICRDMSRQIELNIGKDLQFIRINGTLVGGTIGLLLWLLSQIPSLLHLHIG